MPKIDDASVDQELEMPASRWSDDENVVALIGSMLWHTIVILGIAMVPTTIYEDPNQVVIESNPTSPPEEIEVLTEVSYSEEPQTEIGAESLTDSAMAEASAAEMLEIAEIPTPLEMEPIDRGEFLSNPV
ncbi:MAG: VWA domain-containing protein, partial [Planctomycetota bacterium]